MYLSVRIPLVAFSKTKCNTFCRKVPPAKICKHLATQDSPVVTTMRDALYSFEPLLNVFAARPARWAEKSLRADPGHVEHSYSSSRDRGPPRPLPMEGRRDQGRWQAFVGGRAGTGFVAMAATTKTVVESLAAVLNGDPVAMRKMMTCDQGRKMHGHKIFTEGIGLRIDSVDAHGLWQRAQLELQRSAAPVPSQSIDLSICSQDALNVIALSLNMRPRTKIKCLYTTHSIAITYNEHCSLTQCSTWSLTSPGVKYIP